MRWIKDLFGVSETFTDRMSQVVETHALEVVHGDHESCLVVIECLGARLETFAMLHDDAQVTLTIFSTIHFPKGRLPGSMCNILERMNEKLQWFQYGPHNGRKDSRFVVRATISFSQFTPESFAAAVQEMAPRITALDEVLEKNGYVR